MWIINLYIILSWGIYYSFLAYIKSKKLSQNYNQVLFASFHVWSVSLIIATMANTIIDQPRTTVFFFTMTGLSISYVINKNEKTYVATNFYQKN